MRVIGVPIAVVGCVALVAACGRLGFDSCPSGCGQGSPSEACTQNLDCASGACIDGMCCDRACAGTCNTCATGTCEPVPAACSGDCASCETSTTGFSCTAVTAACASLCASAVCAGSGTTFACSTASCCATGASPNINGSCSSGIDVLLGDGCSFEYDYTSVAIANYYIEIDWDVEECQNGAWVTVDSGADAYPCSGCAVEMRNVWSDTCGNASARAQVCP